MPKLILPGRVRQPAEPVHINVTTLEGHVVIQFNRALTEFALTPQDAAEFARKIAQVTAALAPGRGDIIS